MEKGLPQFKGKALIEIPANIPQAGFLEGDFGKAFLEEYNGRVKSDYNDSSALKVLSYDNNIVKGSNPFAVVLANQILRQEGLRTASQADLEKVISTNAFNLKGTYEDTGLVLRSMEEPNKYLAENLAKQIKARGKKIRTPIMFSLNGLEVVNDSNSPQGLAFKITDETELIYALILDGKNNGKSFSQTDKYGLPSKLGEGSRTLYTRENGLDGFYLCRYSDVDSSNGNLASSNDNGLVVAVANPAGTQKILNDYLKNLQIQRDKEVAEIDKRYQKAEKVLGGK